MKKGRDNRQWRNFLLQPMLQLRMGFYNAFLVLLFVAVIGFYMHTKLSDFGVLIQTLTEGDAGTRDLINQYLSSVSAVVISLGAIFVVITIVASVLITHKMVGPTVAFRRQIKALSKGDYRAKVFLRKGDAFREVAQDLNQLADDLLKKERQERKDKSA